MFNILMSFSCGCKGFLLVSFSVLFLFCMVNSQWWYLRHDLKILGMRINNLIFMFKEEHLSSSSFSEEVFWQFENCGWLIGYVYIKKIYCSQIRNFEDISYDALNFAFFVASFQLL